jgi:predicted nucleic acid-binding protein
MALICDTGPLLAALDAADSDHARCARLITSAQEDLVVPALVLAELDHWCARRRELQADYADLALGIVDSTIVALAERPGEAKIATLDHRPLRAVRTVNARALELLP